MQAATLVRPDMPSTEGTPNHGREPTTTERPKTAGMAATATLDI